MVRIPWIRPCHAFSLVLIPVLGLCPGLSGCGTDGEIEDSFTNPTHPPTLSCSDLEIQDPVTGGTFTCIACNREWQWDIQHPVERIFFLVDLTCRDTTGGRLRIIHPKGSVLWQQEIEKGAQPRFCVPLEDPSRGLYKLSLCGPPPLNLTSFAGSISINLYDHRGGMIEPER